jgi:hypothetical protein
MVTDTGKTLRADTLKPVNLPESIKVEEDAAGLPVALKAGRWQKIIAIDDHWRIDDEWWRSDPVARLYYAVHLASGNRVVLYKDIARNAWYKQTL